MDDGAPATGDGLLVQPDSESGDAKQGGIGQSPGSKQPRRSLEALGIGSHNPFFADPLARMPVVKPTPTERFQQSMRSSVAQADQRRGLGPEGPLLARLERETINSSTPADSSAKFRAATNERGELVSLTLLEATSESRLWEEVARRTLGALGGQRLVANSSTARVRMDLRVISRVQLASGKDPGLGVDVLRLPVKRRPKKNSSRLSFLRIDPKVLDQEVRMPSGDYVKVPMLSLGSLFELGVDPVDIVPKARRVVRTHLERIEALP